MAELRQICTELLMQKSTPHENIVSISDCYCWNDELYVRFDSSFECRLWWSTWTAEVWQVWLGKKSTGRKSILHTYVSVFSKQCVWSQHSPHSSRLGWIPSYWLLDIKSDNILINGNGEVKLADFGFAVRVTSQNEQRKSKVGTPFWMVSWTHSRRGIHK